MAIVTLQDVSKTTGALLGIDPGTKTYGLAISDKTRLIATPYKTIKRKKFSKDVISIFEAFDEFQCSGLVVGFPVNMDGSEGPRCQSVRDFVQNLLSYRDFPVVLWDERMSTMAVTRTMLEADLSRAKRAENVDKLAASYILQGLLDRLQTK